MSQSQLNAVFVTQRTSLLRTLQRMVDNLSTAEDILQETYLRVTRAAADQSIEHLEPFIFQTARNLARDHLRSRKLHARTLVEDAPQDVVHSVAAPSGTPEDAAHAAQLIEHLAASLSRLTSRQQQIFQLSRVHGLSYVEIAERLEVSPSTVQKELKLIMAICMGVAARHES